MSDVLIYPDFRSKLPRMWKTIGFILTCADTACTAGLLKSKEAFTDIEHANLLEVLAIVHRNSRL
jgi:hypothetical protein